MGFEWMMVIRNGGKSGGVMMTLINNNDEWWPKVELLTETETRRKSVETDEIKTNLCNLFLNEWNVISQISIWNLSHDVLRNLS